MLGANNNQLNIFDKLNDLFRVNQHPQAVWVLHSFQVFPPHP
jgi:hypothetical protein